MTKSEFRATVAALFVAAHSVLGQDALDSEVPSLRERLTEREDETRVEDPLTIDLFGRPLALSGQLEAALDFFHRLALGPGAENFGQLRLDQELELEAFYSISRPINFFAQLRLGMEEDLDSETPEAASDYFVERGEFWLYLGTIAGSDFSLDFGRLNFEDDRRWWWDEELDAVRLIYENKNVEVALAAARELLPARSDQNSIDPEEAGICRIILEASWDWNPNHTIQLFGLRQEDTHQSNADLTWLGLRLAGAGEMEKGGTLGYWLDAGAVRGDERISDREGEVTDELFARDVRGWGFDAGVTWLLPAAGDPRLTIGYARGSGDREMEDGRDRAYRQTGLHANEPGFGGVQTFEGYGRLLDPELSNLAIFTAGVGCSLFKASSIDLVFHDYRLVECAESLRAARLDATLTGEDRALGQGLDLVVAIEELREIEFEFSVSAFRAGEAFATDKGEWILGSFIAARFAF